MTKPPRLPQWIAVFATTAAVGLLYGAPITINNPSFEDPVQAPGAFTSGVITDWVADPSTGVWDPSGPWTGALGPVPDGKQVGYSNGGDVSQTLSAFLAPNTTYTLSIDVGGRTDLGNPGTGYAVELLSGSTVIASVVPVSPPIGSWTTVSGGATTPAIIIAGQLSIRISTTAAQFDFDNIRLDATSTSGVPDGGSFGLLALSSAAGLAGFKRIIRALS